MRKVRSVVSLYVYELLVAGFQLELVRSTTLLQRCGEFVQVGIEFSRLEELELFLSEFYAFENHTVIDEGVAVAREWPAFQSLLAPDDSSEVFQNGISSLTKHSYSSKGDSG